MPKEQDKEERLEELFARLRSSVVAFYAASAEYVRIRARVQRDA